MNKFLIICLTIFSASSLSVLGQDMEKGKKLYASCIQCHGEAGRGNIEEAAPRIAGQYDWYILSSLNEFKSGTRKNEKMLPYIQKLNEQDFKDLAAYVSQLK